MNGAVESGRSFVGKKDESRVERERETRKAGDDGMSATNGVDVYYCIVLIMSDVRWVIKPAETTGDV